MCLLCPPHHKAPCGLRFINDEFCIVSETVQAYIPLSYVILYHFITCDHMHANMRSDLGKLYIYFTHSRSCIHSIETIYMQYISRDDRGIVSIMVSCLSVCLSMIDFVLSTI